MLKKMPDVLKTSETIVMLFHDRYAFLHNFDGTYHNIIKQTLFEFLIQKHTGKRCG